MSIDWKIIVPVVAVIGWLVYKFVKGELTSENIGDTIKEVLEFPLVVDLMVYLSDGRLTLGEIIKIVETGMSYVIRLDLETGKRIAEPIGDEIFSASDTIEEDNLASLKRQLTEEGIPFEASTSRLARSVKINVDGEIFGLYPDSGYIKKSNESSKFVTLNAKATDNLASREEFKNNPRALVNFIKRV
ncbi:hypothetical protein M1M30_gp042 [Maribacter phage Colly_1]|uniref:Uncharacterized protein n=1 Tax=Maribacter phage Colly_1 TaxID=2745691 RepID=A0A8E4UY16_9CAUD|nr:hypothetical protein M1M30_gp042 [Maribacter phage Colly_1]QQO97325.1 hypothetical protein Colly1_42 [Maribacter phage Colly_1]